MSVVLIPQGLAYAYLAGLDPVYGLYAALIPLVIYPLFGTSRFLSVGPVALMSILILAGASEFASPGSTEYLHIVFQLALLAGALQMLFALLNLGSLSNFLSKPVINGFISAAAVIIIVSQFSNITGVDVERSSSLYKLLISNAKELGNANRPTVILGISALALSFLLKRINDRIPDSLIIAIMGMLLTMYFGWQNKEVSIVENLPQGLPNFDYSFFRPEIVLELMPSAFVISLVCFIASYSIAKAFEEDQENIIKANKELFALGLSKVIGSFFGGMASSASFARSAINNKYKVASAMTNFIAAIILVLILLFFNRLFYFLPYAVLAAIIISTVIKLVKLDYGRKLFKIDKKDFYIFLLTFIFTITFGITRGILIGIGLSLVSVLYRVSNPHYAILGRLPGTNSFRNASRFTNARTLNDVIIFRYDQDLFFANHEHFIECITEEIRNNKDASTLILHMGSIQSLDSVGIETIKKVIEYAHGKSLKIIFTNLSGPLRDIFMQNKIVDMLNSESLYLDVADALIAIESDESPERIHLSTEYSKQSNPID